MKNEIIHLADRFPFLKKNGNNPTLKLLIPENSQLYAQTPLHASVPQRWVRILQSPESRLAASGKTVFAGYFPTALKVKWL